MSFEFMSMLNSKLTSTSLKTSHLWPQKQVNCDLKNKSFVADILEEKVYGTITFNSCSADHSSKKNFLEIMGNYPEGPEIEMSEMKWS